MTNQTDKNFSKLLRNIQCSHCKNDFNEESIIILEKENNLYTTKLICQKCKKDFGKIIINIPKASDKKDLTIIEGAEPITSDDVIDAHKFIKYNL